MLRHTLFLVGLCGLLGSTGAAFSQEEHPGWPKVFGHALGHPSVADLDGDGTLEVIFAVPGGNGFEAAVHAYHHDGRSVEGWPYEFPDGHTSQQPRIGDVDGDGQPEVVIKAIDLYYVLSHEGSLQDGWPQDVVGVAPNTDFHGLGDLDGDGDLEILIMASTPHELHAFHGDGEPVDGWPIDIAPDFDWDEIYFAELAIGDLDFDGRAEVVPGAYAYNEQTQFITTPITVYNGDGTIRDGWPVTIDQSLTHQALLYPAIADLDGDHECEIIGSSLSTNFFFRSDGRWFQPPEAHFGLPRPNVAADIDGDGDLEMIAPKTTLRIYDMDDGLVAETDPTTYRYFEGVTAGDVDGDGIAEIAAWSLNYLENGSLEPRYALHLYDAELNDLPGWPLEGYAIGEFWNTLLADLDADGDLELIFKAKDDNQYEDDQIHILDLEKTGDGPVRVEWQAMGHDATHGHFYDSWRVPRQVLVRGDGDLDASVDIADAVSLLNYLFLEGETDCPVAFDLDLDGELGLEDAVALLDFLFLEGPPPPMPFPECGFKPPRELLHCLDFECPPEKPPAAPGHSLGEPPTRRP